MVHLLQLINQYWYINIHWSSYFIQISCSVLFCFRIPHRISNYIWSCLLRLFMAATFSVLMTLTVLRSLVSYLVGCPSVGIYLIFCSFRLELRIWGRKTTQLKCHFHYISRVNTINNMNLHRLILTWSPGYG